MKSWFCKDTQKWVSEIPRAFWLGVYDYKTGEKLYSDDILYSADPTLRWIHKEVYIRIGKLRNDCRGLEFGKGEIPILRYYRDSYTKYI